MKFQKKQQLYKIQLPHGALSSKSMPDVLDALARSGFEPIDDNPREVESSGFVSVLDEDRDIASDGISFGSLYLCGYRTDTRKADKREAKAILNREIKKGAVYDKKGKKDRLEQIMMGLVERAAPVPSSQIMILDPENDALFVQAAKQKKAETLFSALADALGLSFSNVSFCEDEDEDERRLFLEHLWLESEAGRGLEFEPKSVAGDETQTSSTDAADLAFGRVNGKKCSSGVLTLENGVVVELKSDTFHALKIAASLDSAPEDGGELLGFTAEIYRDAFKEVFRLYNERSPQAEDKLKESFEIQARRVLA